MLYKNFKDLKISALGMGCMRLPKTADNTIDYPLARQVIEYAYNNGINYFDTAYPYHSGESERFVGSVLRQYERSSFYLADKMPIWEIYVPTDPERIFNEQLEKCGTTYFDFYLCHAMNKSRHQKCIDLGIYKFLEKMKETGKIKYLGFSFHDDLETLKEIVNYRDWDFCQIQYNYLDVSVQHAKDLYDFLKEKKIPSIVMEPVRGGFLAHLKDDYTNLLKELDENATPASFAIRYAVSKENNFVTLSGMSSMEQVIDNINTVSNFKPITEKENQTLDLIAKGIMTEDYIPCTGCHYCYECPMHIYIPKIFQAYNEYLINHNLENLRNAFEKAEGKYCIKCHYCESKCPQKIKIPENIEKIKQLIS